MISDLRPGDGVAGSGCPRPGEAPGQGAETGVCGVTPGPEPAGSRELCAKVFPGSWLLRFFLGLNYRFYV